MTEAEAKGKGCPWARLHSQSAINRTPGGVYHPNAMCQGSKCMAWLWVQDDKQQGICSLTGQSGNQES
jgi:hypothetical protein